MGDKSWDGDVSSELVASDLQQAELLSHSNDGQSSSSTCDTTDMSALANLITKFENLLAEDLFLKMNHRLYLSMECLDSIFDTLLNSRYVPKNVRIYLAKIIQYQKPDSSAESIAVLNTPISELRVIDKKTRSSILPILEAFRAEVSTLNRQHTGNYFKLDGFLKEEFVDFLKMHIHNISSIQVVSYCPINKVGTVLVHTTTTLEPGEKTELIRIVDEYGYGCGETISMEWKERQIVDDQFKFGILFPVSIVHQQTQATNVT